MTEPTLDLSNILPRAVVLRPLWNNQIASVMPDFRDDRVSNPAERVWIPPGVTTIRCTSDTRFLVTVKYERGSYTGELGDFNSTRDAKFEVTSEAGAELWFELSSMPNTSDQANTRIGIRIQPMGKALPTS